MWQQSSTPPRTVAVHAHDVRWVRTWRVWLGSLGDERGPPPQSWDIFNQPVIMTSPVDSF